MTTGCYSQVVWTGWTSTAATTSEPWGYWNTASTTASATGGVWGTWCTTTATSDTTGTGASVWATWSDGHVVTRIAPVCATQPQLTAEEAEKLAEAAREREEQARKVLEKSKAAREAAEKCARELLLSVLSEEQRKEYERDKAFHVEAKDGTRYRLKHGWAGNVEELNELGIAIARYCIHPNVQIPEADNLVAQKLMLETDPERFRRTANRTDLATRA